MAPAAATRIAFVAFAGWLAERGGYDLAGFAEVLRSEAEVVRSEAPNVGEVLGAELLEIAELLLAVQAPAASADPLRPRLRLVPDVPEA